MKRQRKSINTRLRFAFAMCALVAFAVIWGTSPAVAEAPLPLFAKARLGSDRFSASVTATAFGAQAWVITGTENGYVRLWDTDSEYLRWEARPTTQPVQALALTPAAAVALTNDGQAFVLNTANGAAARSFKVNPCDAPCSLRSVQATDSLLLTHARLTDAKGEHKSVLRLWSLTDGKRLQDFTTATIYEVALSPSGNHVAWVVNGTDSLPTHVALANVTDLSHSKALPCDLERANEDSTGLPGLLFSPDAKTLAAFGLHSDRSSVSACFWDAGTPGAPRAVRLPAASDLTLLMGEAMFSANSQWLAIAYEEVEAGLDSYSVDRRDIFYIEAATGRSISTTTRQTLDGKDARADINTLTDSPWAANHAATPTIQRHPVQPLQALRSGHKVFLGFGQESEAYQTFPPAWMVAGHHTGEIQEIVTNADGSLVASFKHPADYTADTIESSHALIWRPGQADAVTSLNTNGRGIFSADGGLFELGGAVIDRHNDECDSHDGRPGDFGLWNLSTFARQSLRQGPKLMIRSIHPTPDGKLLTCRVEHEAEWSECGNFSADDNEFPDVNSVLELWDPGDPSAPARVLFSSTPGGTAYCGPLNAVSPVAMRAAIWFETEIVSPENEDPLGFKGYTVVVIDLHSGKRLLTVIGDERHPSLSPDGKRLAVFQAGSETDPLCKLTLHDVDADKALFENKQPCAATAFSPESQRLLVAASDGFTIHDASSGLLIKTITGHARPVVSFSFSGDGKTLFTAQADGLIYAWDWPAILATL